MIIIQRAVYWMILGMVVALRFAGKTQWRTAIYQSVTNRSIKCTFGHFNQLKFVGIFGFTAANTLPQISLMRQKNNYTPFADLITAGDYGMQCDAATVIPLRYDMFAWLLITTADEASRRLSFFCVPFSGYMRSPWEFGRCLATYNL